MAHDSDSDDSSTSRPTARVVWKGDISVDLVLIPVALYTATTSQCADFD